MYKAQIVLEIAFVRPRSISFKSISEPNIAIVCYNLAPSFIRYFPHCLMAVTPYPSALKVGSLVSLFTIPVTSVGNWVEWWCSGWHTNPGAKRVGVVLEHFPFTIAATQWLYVNLVCRFHTRLGRFSPSTPVSSYTQNRNLPYLLIVRQSTLIHSSESTF